MGGKLRGSIFTGKWVNRAHSGDIVRKVKPTTRADGGRNRKEKKQYNELIVHNSRKNGNGEKMNSFVPGRFESTRV